MRGWSRGEMRLTERLLSARGRGSRVVVTVMLWARGAGFVWGGVGSEDDCCGLLGEGGAEAEEAEKAGDFYRGGHLVMIARDVGIWELVLFYCK